MKNKQTIIQTMKRKIVYGIVALTGAYIMGCDNPEQSAQPEGITKHDIFKFLDEKEHESAKKWHENYIILDSLDHMISVYGTALKRKPNQDNMHAVYERQPGNKNIEWFTKQELQEQLSKASRWRELKEKMSQKTAANIRCTIKLIGNYMILPGINKTTSFSFFLLFSRR